jgi:hypothetical protein
VEVIGGKRIPCPTCAASGKVRVPLTALTSTPPATAPETVKPSGQRSHSQR